MACASEPLTALQHMEPQLTHPACLQPMEEGQGASQPHSLPTLTLTPKDGIDFFDSQHGNSVLSGAGKEGVYDLMRINYAVKGQSC